jgi:hypothetical protein
MKNGRVGMANITAFDIRCEILSDLWMEYRDDEAFKELIEYADLGFPLAYAIFNGIVPRVEQAEDFINGTFDLLLQSLGVEDTGFENLNGLFDTAEGKSKE